MTKEIPSRPGSSKIGIDEETVEKLQSDGRGKPPCIVQHGMVSVKELSVMLYRIDPLREITPLPLLPEESLKSLASLPTHRATPR